MQAIPECRKRVWKKEWQQIVGSQTSFLTGTKRTANRHKHWREKKGGGSIWQKRDDRMDGGKDRGKEAEMCKCTRKQGEQRKEIKEKFMDVALYAMDMTYSKE